MDVDHMTNQMEGVRVVDEEEGDDVDVDVSSEEMVQPSIDLLEP